MKTLAETMNETEENFYRQARAELLRGLALLTPANHRIFRYMYAAQELRQSGPTEEELAMSLEEVVAAMPDEKLDWAVQQVQRSVDKL